MYILFFIIQNIIIQFTETIPNKFFNSTTTFPHPRNIADNEMPLALKYTAT